jgi:arginine:ornithine antiporter / lysine permease
LKFILLGAVIYAPGTALYFWARREQGKPVFTGVSDWVIFGLAVVGAIVGVYALVTGAITI